MTTDFLKETLLSSSLIEIEPIDNQTELSSTEEETSLRIGFISLLTIPQESDEISRYLRSIWVKKQTWKEWKGWKDENLSSIISNFYQPLMRDSPVHINPAKKNILRGKLQEEQDMFVIRYYNSKIIIQFESKLKVLILFLFNYMGIKCFYKPANTSIHCKVKNKKHSKDTGKIWCPCKNCRHWFAQRDGLITFFEKNVMKPIK